MLSKLSFGVEVSTGDSFSSLGFSSTLTSSCGGGGDGGSSAIGVLNTRVIPSSVCSSRVTFLTGGSAGSVCGSGSFGGAAGGGVSGNGGGGAAGGGVCGSGGGVAAGWVSVWGGIIGGV